MNGKSAATDAKGAIPTHYRPTHAPNFTPPPGTGAGRRGYNLFVGTLPAGTQKDDLEILFSPFGSMTDTYMLKQEGLGGRRCGFVSYSDYASAALAIVILNGYIVREGELPICVRFANPVKQREGANAAAAATTSPNATPKDGPALAPPPPPLLTTPQHLPQAAPLPSGLKQASAVQIPTPQQVTRKGRRQAQHGPPSPKNQSLLARTTSPDTASTNDSFSNMEFTPCPSVVSSIAAAAGLRAQRTGSAVTMSTLNDSMTM